MQQQNVQKLGEVLNDPAKLDAALKKAFAKLDAQNQGFISFATLDNSLKMVFAALGMPGMTLSPEQKARMKQEVDPAGNDKITCDNFSKFFSTKADLIKKQLGK